MPGSGGAASIDMFLPRAPAWFGCSATLPMWFRHQAHPNRKGRCS
jgi:hypothetical protein